jgi:DNA-binding winged helix-turn-helix (wHTH) protein
MESPAPQPALRFGSYEVDVCAGELRKNGIKVHIQDKPLRLLGVLAGRHGKLVTREELHGELWPGHTFVEYEDGLNTAVRKLRETLSDHCGKPRFIETVPRRGYRFIAPVQEVFGSPVAGLEADADLKLTAAPGQLAVRERRGPFGWASVLALAVVAAVSVYVAWKQSRA